MRITGTAVAFLFLTMSASLYAADDLGGKDQFPQFRVQSGLSGGGFGVLPNGRPSVMGAAALTTPIGYTISNHGSFSLFNTSGDSNPFVFRERNGYEDANGTGTFLIGGEYKGWRGSVGYMILSKNLDAAFNFQVSPPTQGRVGVSFGVQDLSGGGGSAGTGGATDDDSSRSFFGAATYDFGHSVYGTLGVGSRRFKGVFGNASAPITPRLRATVEYDTFNWNAGLLYGAGRIKDLGGRLRDAEANFFLGLVAGKYGTIGVTLTL